MREVLTRRTHWT